MHRECRLRSPEKAPPSSIYYGSARDVSENTPGDASFAAAPLGQIPRSRTLPRFPTNAAELSRDQPTDQGRPGGLIIPISSYVAGLPEPVVHLGKQESREQHPESSRKPQTVPRPVGISGVLSGSLLVGHYRLVNSIAARMKRRGNNAVTPAHPVRVTRLRDHMPASMSMIVMGTDMMHQSTT
jgi:hypothetical protein